MTTYLVEPKRNKRVMTKEYFNNHDIHTDSVRVIVSILWRWGSFSLELSDDEYADIKDSQEIIISDYDYYFNDLYDVCDIFIEIENEESYSEEELKKINKSIYESDEFSFNEDYMNLNGWISDDTEYIITEGCKFTLQI